MGEITRIDTIDQYNGYFGVPTHHPLVSVIDCSEASPVRYSHKLYGVFSVMIKDVDCGALKYGRSLYDYTKGTMIFVAPGQVMGADDDGVMHQPKGWILAFHPEFLRGTGLSKIMRDYTFFSYNANEALHLSDTERTTIIDCLKKIKAELQHPVDKHTKSLVVDNIRLMLDYCVRFYDRQFITRENVNSDTMARFESLLDDYFNSDAPAEKGSPTVQYCADRLCMSPNYLSDMLRKETGMSALKHIQQKMADVAKERVVDMTKTISEVSYQLGFPYPQHFSRWFKRVTGYTPNEYRRAN